MKRIGSVGVLFIAAVVVPTLLAIVYYGLLASDVYVSEARFVVRSSEGQGTSPLGLILKGAGFTRSQDDTYTVHDFIVSRDALRELDRTFDLQHAFGHGGIDYFNRFGTVDGDRSFEALFKYYERRVDVRTDAASSISTLVVRAFSADEAVGINEKLLQMSEGLVNRLNERGRQDMIRFAAAEVASAETKARAAASAVSVYRNDQSVLDPEKQAQFQLQQVGKLQEELIATRTQLAQLRTFTPQNPQIPAVAQKVKTLESDIASESSKAAGGGARSLASKAAQYQRLALELEFAEKQLASSLVSLEQAKAEAQRQQLYLERIVQPSRPDIATEPRRLRSVLITFVLGLIAWGVASLLYAGVKEHHA